MNNALAWSAPVIDDGRAVRRGSEQQRLEEERRFAEAETRGKAAGIAAAQKEIDAQRRALDERAQVLMTALDALARPLAHVDDQVHEQIAALAMHLARGLLRRELRTDPAQVIGIVRETVALLPAATRGVRVSLHPEDAALLREKVVTSGPEPAWTVIDDPALSRGDCRVHTDYAQIDARMETRLKEALAALLGDERSAPRHPETP
jgi:flagellar assembly protein FliH